MKYIKCTSRRVHIIICEADVDPTHKVVEDGIRKALHEETA